MNFLPESIRYMAAPMTVCIAITCLLTYLGIHVLRREVIFVDLSLAQIAALGATYAFYLGYDPMGDVAYAYALSFTCLGAVLFSLTGHRRSKVPQEAIIGISYAVAAGAAILLVDMAKDPHGGEKIQFILVGNLVWVSWIEVVKTTAVCAAVGVFHTIFRKTFFKISFHPEEAEKEGVSLKLWDFLFYLSFGFAITGIVRVTGVLLVFSYLIIPATIATLCTERIGGRLLIGWLTGLGVSFFGLLFSYDRPSGPMIVTLFGFCLVLFSGLRYLYRSRNRAKTALLLGVLLSGVFLLLAGLPLLTPTESEKQVGGGVAPAPLSESFQIQGLESDPVEPAADGSVVEKALRNLKSADPDLRDNAIGVLSIHPGGAVLDAMAKALERETDGGLKLRMAGILQARGREKGLVAYLDLLKNSDFPFLRVQALDALEEISGKTFGYDPLKTKEENAEALRRWKNWWRERGKAN